MALTDDGGHLRLYVDGELAATAAAPEHLNAAAGPLTIGCDLYGSHFIGRIDEVHVYDRALSGGEVDASMETPIETAKQGPVAAYSFDEGTGTTVEDLSGDENEGTVEGGAEWKPGRFGESLQFAAGEGECVTVPNSESLRLPEEVTIEAWIRPEGSLVNDPIVAKEGGEEGPDYSYRLGLGVGPSGTLEGYAGEEEVRKYGVIEPNVWTHVAFTYDGARDRLYVNGELVASESVGSHTLSSKGPLRIGCSAVAEQTFHGRIDEVRIYERALSGGEVAGDMESPLQTPRQGPVASFSFDSGNETTAEDLTAGGPSGTIEGGAAPATGRYGKSLYFDGETGCVSIEATPELQPTEEFTAEAWVRPDHAETEAQPVIALQDPAAGEGEEGYAYQLLGGGEEEPKAWARKDGEGGYDGVYASAPLEANVWAHLALTDDGAHLRLYVDGGLVATAKAPEHLGAAAGPLTIGCDIFGGHFKGRIDEVRIYNRALGGPEVGTDMESPIQTPKQGPVAAYSFDEESEETAKDVSLNEHDGAVEGPAWTEHGRYGGAYEFKGEDTDCISVPNSEALQLTEELSVEAWVKPEGSGESEPIIVKETPSSFSYALYLGKTKPGHIEGLVEEAGSESSVTGDPVKVEKNVWSQVDMTFDGAYMRLYVDGEEVDKVKANGPQFSTGQLSIGCSKEFGDSFTGRIDEVRLYDRALSQSEIRERPETGLAECAAPNSRAASEPRTRPLAGGGTETSYRLGEGQMLYTATPPSSFDPLTATAQELEEFGLPPKPSDPEMREEWETTWGDYQPIKPQPSTAPCETEQSTEWQPTVELEEEGEESEEASSSG